MRRTVLLLLVTRALVSVVSLGVWKFLNVLRLHQANQNLRAMGKAMFMYREAHGKFPPAVVYDENGKRIHSWRSLIGPYLKSSEPASQTDREGYRLSEAWDSPHNLAANKRHGATRYEYSFFAITGKNTAWPRDGIDDFNAFADGTSNTILVIGIKNPGVGWHEPVDFKFDGSHLWLHHNGERKRVSTKP